MTISHDLVLVLILVQESVILGALTYTRRLRTQSHSPIQPKVGVDLACKEKN